MNAIDLALDGPPKIEEAKLAEAELLGCCILDPSCIDSLIDVVSFTDFYQQELGKLFAFIVDKRLAGEPVRDTGYLAIEGVAAGVLPQNGARLKLAKLAALIPNAANALHRATLVRKYARRRAIDDLALRLSRDCRDDGIDEDAIAENAIVELERIVASCNSNVTALSELVTHVVGKIADSRDNGIEAGLSTGLYSLDEKTGGLFDGEMTILAARPSIGKSALALDIAMNCASQGKTVLLFSLEMEGEQIATRQLSRETGIASRQIQKAAITDHQMLQLRNAEENSQSSNNLQVFSLANCTPAKIAAIARLTKAQRGLDLVIVDYLGLIDAHDNRLKTYERVTWVSRELKKLALTIGKPFLVLAQLNRETEKSGKPTLHHLRDSGAVEQDADNVWLLHRESKDATVCELMIAKQRQGEADKTVYLEYDGASMRFQDCVGIEWTGK